MPKTRLITFQAQCAVRAAEVGPAKPPEGVWWPLAVVAEMIARDQTDVKLRVHRLAEEDGEWYDVTPVEVTFALSNVLSCQVIPGDPDESAEADLGGGRVPPA